MLSYIHNKSCTRFSCTCARGLLFLYAYENIVSSNKCGAFVLAYRHQGYEEADQFL